MRYIKLGNTMFLSSLIQGIAVNEAPNDFTGQFKYRVTVYLDSGGLRAVTYPCKTKETADLVLKELLEESKVINIEEACGITPVSEEDVMKDGTP
jgi:hypothetical protein